MIKVLYHGQFWQHRPESSGLEPNQGTRHLQDDKEEG
jgi:hypothetical protein